VGVFGFLLSEESYNSRTNSPKPLFADLCHQVAAGKHSSQDWVRSHQHYLHHGRLQWW